MGTNLGSLARLQSELALVGDAHAVVDRLAAFCGEEFSLCTAWLYRFEGSEDAEMRLVAVRGRHASHMQRNLPAVLVAGDPMLVALERGMGPIFLPTAEAIRANNPVVANQMQNQALIVTPVVIGGAHRGVIGAGAFKDDGPPQLEQDQLDAFALVGAMVTERLAMLRKLERAKRDLQHMAEHAHEDRQGALQLMAAGLVHDLNNMLSVMRTSVELLRGSSLDPDQREDLEVLSEAERRAAQLASQLSALRRTSQLELEPIDVAELIDRAVRLVRPTLLQEQSLEVVGNPAPFSVRADAPKLVQVLVNLLVNARDACTCDGTIVVTCRTCEELEESWPRPEPDFSGPFVRIEVEDDGVGMTDAVRTHIFEPYFSTKDEGHGTGLGLAVAFAIAAQHRGALTCVSARGEGTRFALYLPIWQG